MGLRADVKMMALPLLLATSAFCQAPQSMLELCQGQKNIIKWANIPHDWNKTDESSWRGDGTSNPSYLGKDWWYWGDDWKQKIADGDVDMEPNLNEEYIYYTGGPDEKRKEILGKCNADTLRDIPNVGTVTECRLACAFEYSTQTDVREKCQWFSYDQGSKHCVLYSRCGWPLDDSDNDDITDSDLLEKACWGQESRSQDCSWSNKKVWRTYRVVDIYPAGFQPFSLREFNQPPLCIHVPESSDKKVEVMIETETNDSRLCIMDGRDMGVYTNDVGNVRTCDNGKLYSCFTAATKKAERSGQDFYFYISCEGSCEASDVDVWIRLRKSERSWDEGKKDWATDIEYWCEHERGTEAYEQADSTKVHPEFQYPSELLPREPREYPYRITKGMDRSGAGFVKVFMPLLLCITMVLF